MTLLVTIAFIMQWRDVLSCWSCHRLRFWRLIGVFKTQKSQHEEPDQRE